MRVIENQTFDEERAFYGCDGLKLSNCRFDGPADGESALKEGKNIVVEDCFFNLRYPFWHDHDLKIERSELTGLCRAALWYSDNIEINDTKLHGIKALRECAKVKINNCDVDSPEFGWSVSDMEMNDSHVKGEYFMLRSDDLHFNNVSLEGKYSFQYIENCVFTDCHFDTKDAFWHAKNVVVKDCYVKGEYLAWYCENVTFENCTIISTQPLCYCKGLKLINCRMIDCDLAFEKSDVEATIISSVDSIKNPHSGKITVESVGEIIMDDPDAKGKIYQTKSTD